MKRKTAKEILAESFREIADNKPVDKITVMDITENCGYSTTTFYRHFHDKYDLMAWEYAIGLEKALDEIEKAGSGWKQVCLECALHFHKQRDYLKNLLQNTGGFDSFARYMNTVHYECLKNMIISKAGEAVLDVHLEMCARAYCYGAVDISCGWIMEHYNMSPKDMALVYIDSLSVLLHNYLLKDG